ncbi:MAG: transglutaminase family protein [Candidatus Melainabacteria bacterium]|jgi:transglutaminase-like putative cysteine protease|nr:MAG: transglutaminase family protein [Candidatus Melainabacteria bacterium]
MYIRVGYEMVFDFPNPTAMIFLLHLLPSRAGDLCHPDELKITPNVPISEFTDWFGNRCARIVAPAGKLTITSDTIVKDSGVPDPAVLDAVQHPVEELPPECLQFLLPSRYCEVDKLGDAAWELFGNLPPGWARAQAVCDWVFDNVKFGYQFANATKGAYEVYQDRKGVCRDFTHLAVTFCRALNIPARYATGYLGDIGVSVDSPMDFSACFQCYLGGKWHTFDARHNVRRIGWILVATGRDAADCAITTSFGPHTLDKFLVWADEVPTDELIMPRPLDPRLAAAGF